jgi:hypothetical protein
MSVANWLAGSSMLKLAGTGTVESMFVDADGQFCKFGATVEMVLRRRAHCGNVVGVRIVFLDIVGVPVKSAIVFRPQGA